MQFDLNDNEKELIKLKVKKEVGVNKHSEWKLGVVGDKVIKKTIDETISKLNEKFGMLKKKGE